MNNVIEEKMDGYLSELKSVEKTLNKQLNELSTSIDASFGAVSEMVQNITDIAVKSSAGLVSSETRSKIGAVGALASKTVSMAGNIYKARKHNEALEKLLAAKQTIASAKADELRKIEPIVHRVHDNLKRGLMNEGSKVYPLAEMNTKEKWTLVIDRMDKYLDMYRTSVYLGMVIEYLQAEYQAWLDGKQTSHKMRPDYYAANLKVVKLLEDAAQEESRQAFLDVFEGNPQALSGSTIYYLMDSQLSGTVLSKIKDTYSLEQPSNAGIRQVIEGNAAIEDYMKEGNSLEYDIEDGPEHCYYSYKYTFGAAAAITIAYFFLDFSFWFIPLAFIAAWIVGNNGEKKDEMLSQAHKCNIYLRSLDMKEKAKKNAGYVNLPQKNLEKKSLVKAALLG